MFLAVWRDPGRYDPVRGTIATWLMTLAHHKAVDAVRREQNRRRGEAPADHRTAPTSPGADVAALAGALTTQVRDALWSLPAEPRETLAWAYYGGRTQNEVAVLTGVPVGTVKSRTFHAVRRLRPLLETRADPAEPTAG